MSTFNRDFVSFFETDEAKKRRVNLHQELLELWPIAACLIALGWMIAKL